MPHLDNILSPLTIVGNGRSGTSLVSRVLADHPQVQFVGETANLIHGVWKSLEAGLPDSKLPQIPEVIRHQFLHLFPGESPAWMHKPIGVPIVWSLFDEDEFLAWYWQVMEAVFPSARFFTVLRHPLDVAISSHSWWGWSLESILNSNRLMAKILTHPDSNVDFAVDYHELILKPKPQVKRLLDFLQLDFDKRCLDAFETGHVINKQTSPDSGPKEFTDRKANAFSHSERWQEIDARLLTDDYFSAIDACWKKYECEFGGWPGT